jgi:hypothetical protein
MPLMQRTDGQAAVADYRPSRELAEIATAFVDAEKAATLLEELKTATLSQMMAKRMAENPDGPVNRVEMTVKASEEWREYITKMVEARRAANLLKLRIKYVEMRSREHQSDQANERLIARA